MGKTIWGKNEKRGKGIDQILAYFSKNAITKTEDCREGAELKKVRAGEVGVTRSR